MAVVLPPVIAAFVEAKNDFNVEAIVDCLTEDAVVEDEGQEIQGLAAIKTWLKSTHAQYNDTLEVTGYAAEGGRHIVTAQVSGNFEGSPVPLDFCFVTKEGKITSLRIRLHGE